VGAHQQPVLVARKAVYFIKDGQWNIFDYQPDYQYDSYNASVVITDIWLPLYGFGRKDEKFLLVHVQADAPHPQVATLVDPLTKKVIHPSMAKTASNGTVLLLGGNTIYTLRDGKLQEQRYLVVYKEELPWIKDFALADDGSLYVLADDTVEKITLDGKQTSTQLPAISVDDRWGGSYNSLEVDAHGRLWLTWYTDAIGVFQPEWNGIARQVVMYDKYNSNYQPNLDVNPFRTRDGRIWAAREHLVWIDSNATQLPSPLPDWLAQMRRPNLIMPIIFFIVSLVAAGFSRSSRLRVKNKR
jgi:hypothetical protein